MAWLALAIVAMPASAHDPDGAWNWWFLMQRNTRGTSCCNGSDAHFLNAMIGGLAVSVIKFASVVTGWTLKIGSY
jgi:hypothetical protein